MKKQTYKTPSINVINITPSLMTQNSPLNMRYGDDNIGSPGDASDAASRGSIFWFDE